MIPVLSQKGMKLLMLTDFDLHQIRFVFQRTYLNPTLSYNSPIKNQLAGDDYVNKGGEYIVEKIYNIWFV